MGGGPRSPQEARFWLGSQGYDSDVAGPLLHVLTQLWAGAWNEGLTAALHFINATVPPQALTDLLLQYGAVWAGEIAGTLLDRLAQVLAEGGTEEELRDALSSVLEDHGRARLIALTEVIRAMGMAAFEAYRYGGVELVEWVTAKDARVCKLCEANQAAGPHYLGDPFPSGATTPPQHPGCRCAIVPYFAPYS